MNIFVCIDDTDNLESRGTGQLSQTFAEAIEKKGWGTCSSISRHQLFVHEDIPYTSHNSSMCFKAHIDKNTLQPLIDFMQKGLEIESAPGSDAGLCVAVDQPSLDRQQLMAFGRKAKDTVLNKTMAYELASDLGVHLSEHGGTGDGIIARVNHKGLAEQITKACPEIATYRPATQSEAIGHSYGCKANWKGLIDNYLECYHCQMAHEAW